MIEFFKNLFKRNTVETKFFPGILGEQNRSNIYDFDEVVKYAGSPVWVEKNPSQWRTFLAQNQSYSSACVAFTTAKIAQILYYLKIGRKIKFSPGWIYKQRSPNIPGMWIDNAVAIAGGGLPTEELYPSENLNEIQINNLPDLPYTDGVAKEFAISVNWVNLPLDFDTIASSLQMTQKGIMLWFEFGDGEFFNQAIPMLVGSYKPYKHSVTAVDVVLYNNIKYIVIEDSYGLETRFNHRKLITQEFFKRCILARYPINFKFDSILIRPHYDSSTESLQDCLKFEGLFPLNIPSTGYLGKITIQAVKDFQKRYNIPQTGTVGMITTAKLKEIFP